MAFQRRTWVAERVGWCLFLLVIVAAGLGLFGAGPLAEVEVASPDGTVRLRYERFARVATETEMTVEVAAARAEGDTLRLQLGPELADRYEIARIVPEPMRMLPAQGHKVMLELGPQVPGEPALVRLWLKPARPGLARSEIGLAGGQPSAFRQLVYP